MYRLIALILLVPGYAFAQVEDTLKPALQLDEVVVVDQDERSELLSMQQSTRQNGIEEIMERMPGLMFIRRGNYAPDLVLNGMRNEQVAITIDGMQVFGACTDRMDPITSYVETNNLLNVSVSGSDLTGQSHSANIAGSINLKTKEPAFGGGWHILFGGGYKFNGNGSNALFNANYGGSKLSVNINAIYRKQHNYIDGNGNEVMYSQFEKYNIAANLRYRIRPNHVLKLSLIADDAFDVGYAALPMDVAFAKARMAGLTTTWYYSEKFFSQLEAKVYYNFVDHAMDDSKRPDVPIRMDMPGTSATWGTYVEAETRALGQQRFFARLEGFSNFRHAEMTMYPPNSSEPPMYMLTWPDVRKNAVLAVIGDEIKITEKTVLSLKAGLQYDYNAIVTDAGEKFLKPFGYHGASSFLLPSIEGLLVHDVNHEQSVSLSTGYSSRGPSTSEQYAFYLFNAYDGYDYIGNPDIKAESALKSTVKYNLKNCHWQLSVSAFGYMIDNYILGVTDSAMDAMTIGANGVRVYQNVGRAYLVGANITSTKKLVSWLHFQIQAGYTHATFENGQNIPLIPPFNGSAALIATPGAWQVLLENEFAARQSRVNQNYGDAVTPGYQITNVRIVKELSIKTGRLIVESGVENLFDKAYRNHLDWGTINRMGRNLYFQLTLSL